MNKLIKKAFTLIELLVVIAIIGILSGLIVVNMGGMNQKATIAKAQVFSNSLRNSLMMDIVSEWKFDVDGNDSWGNNDAVLSGSSIVNSDCLRGSWLNLLGTTASYAIENPYNGFPGSEFTVETWVKTSDTKGSGIISYATTHSDNDFLIIVPSGITVYIYGTGVSTGVKINDNYWHNIIVSWDSSGTIKFYLDGVNKYSGTVGAGISILDGGSLVLGQDQDSVGGSFDSSQSFAGLVDEMRVYKKIIPAFLIKQNYYLGLSNLLVNKRIDMEEYSQRLNSIANE